MNMTLMMKVFLVEDSAAVRERLVEMIGELDDVSVVGEADNYDDAVAGIMKSRPDVAIFDIKLAQGNGIDAMVEVKRHMPELRGIVMSNYATPQHVKASADAGAEYFLDKSADFDKITEILQSMKSGLGEGRH
ncbi:MAG: response regulator transcription factor [Betaproteobacteria bacterium]|nr:response regulator transcription factor [Betaproteobacteria bacterium]